MVLFHLQLLRNFNRFNHPFLNAIAASYFRTAGSGNAFEANWGCNLLIFRKEVMNETTGPEEFQDKIKRRKRPLEVQRIRLVKPKHQLEDRLRGT
jgi:hypothetical protein